MGRRKGTKVPHTDHAPRTLREFLKGPPRVSQVRFARRIGIRQSYVSMILRRQRVPRIDVLLKISRATGIPMEKFAQHLTKRQRR
jgi:plasmid maintenance system antidote protein VapI